MTNKREYTKNVPLGVEQRLADITVEQKRAFIDRVIAYYDDHELVKDSFMNMDTGDACLEGACAVTAMKDQGYDPLDEDDRQRMELNSFFGLVPDEEVILNGTLMDLRDYLIVHGYMDPDDNRTPTAFFNDLPGTDKTAVVQLLQEFKQSYEGAAL